ncbi:MAG: hypothetical protein NT029_06445 [Armatimonadetes bacterium]|jgi:hypothetical protein|nr:hypothetical protein [Armatimonadota bacterium]
MPVAKLVIEGTWEEIAARAGEVAGNRVRLTVLPDGRRRRQSAPRPNVALLAALGSIEALVGDIPARPGADSVALVREARDGGLYDCVRCE